MRQALPLWFCLDCDTREKLVSILSETACPPRDEWADWQPVTFKITPLPLRDIEEAREYYDKFMRQKPQPSPRSRK